MAGNTMKLSVKLEGAQDVKAMLAGMGKAAPDALRMAANSLGEHMQSRMRNEIPKRFTFRGTQSQFNQAVVFRKAIPGRKGRASAELTVGSEDAGRSATKMFGRMLARHEEADSRTGNANVRLSSGLTKNVGFFLPSGQLRNKTTNPPRGLYPHNIGATLYNAKSGEAFYASSTKKTKKVKGVQKVGASFIVTEDGVFRWKHDFSSFSNRKGHSFSDRAEPMWWFTKRIRTPRRLKMWQTANETFDKYAIGHLMDAIDVVTSRST